MLKLGSTLVRIVGASEGLVPKVSAVACRKQYSSAAAPEEYEKHKIPERLQYIPEADDPSFFESVEYFFHRGCQVCIHT